MGLATLFQAIKDVSAADALKIHLEAAIREAEELRRKIAALESENMEIMRENRGLRKQIEEAAPKEEHLDAGICHFKKMPDGKYGETPICPNCNAPIAKAINKKSLCTKCRAIFDDAEIARARRAAISSGG